MDGEANRMGSFSGLGKIKTISFEKTLSYLWLHIGVLLMAVNIHYFMAPNQFASGGLGGLSVVLQSYFPTIPLGGLMGLLNILFFLLGFAFLGFQFGLKTIYASFLLTFFVWMLGRLDPVYVPLSHDLFIQLVVGTLIAGLGLVLVLKQNASTGGMDLIAMIINKYFAIEIGKAVLMADCLISLAAIFAFGMEKGLYACFGVFLRGVVVDYFHDQLQMTKEVVIISEKCEHIKHYIIEQLHKSATLHSAIGAFSNDEKEVITIVLKRQDYIKLKKFIYKIDKNAFITVHNMNEVVGNNFNNVV